MCPQKVAQSTETTLNKVKQISLVQIPLPPLVRTRQKKKKIYELNLILRITSFLK